MTPSRRQFLTGALALGATPLLAQDEKKPYIMDPAEVLPNIDKLKKQWEEERRDNLERLETCNTLERVLLLRYVSPVDTWLNINGYLKIPSFKVVTEFLALDDDKDKSVETTWFLLKITSANPLLGKDIWLKFSIGDSDRKLVWVDRTSQEEDGVTVTKQVFEPFTDTLWRKRDSLLDALEHHLVQLLDDSPPDDGFDIPDEDTESYKRTMIDGTAHFYQLFGPEQDPAKVMKEQLLA